MSAIIMSAVIFAAAAIAAIAAVADVTFDAWLVTALVAALSPVAVAVLTKLHASTSLKRVVAAVVAAVVAYIVEHTLSDGTAVISWGSLALVVVAVVAQQTGYTKVWQEFQLNAKTFPRFGFGRADNPPAPADNDGE